MKLLLIKLIRQYILAAIALVMLISPSFAFEDKPDDSDQDKENYISVPQVAVTMYHKGRPKGSLTVSVLVKLVDSEKRSTAIKFMPRLNSAYVMEANRLSHDYFDVTQPINVAMLGDALQLVTNRVLGHKEARVLIADVIVNKR